MKKAWIVLAVMLALVLVALPACRAATPTPAGTPTPAPLPSYTIKTNAPFPGSGTINHRAMERFNALVEKYSEGRIKVEYYPSPELGELYDIGEMIMRGTGPDFAISLPGTGVDPRWNIMYLGGVFSTYEGAEKAYGPGGWLLKIMDGLAEDSNYKLLGTVSTGFGGLVLKKRGVRNFPEDAQGLKLRVPPLKNFEARGDAMGFITTPLPWGELFMALQTGMVDGGSGQPPMYVYIFKDVVTSYVYTMDYFESLHLMTNLDWWNGLPEQDRQLFQRAADEALAPAWQEVRDEEEGYFQQMRDWGLEVIILTPEEMAKLVELIRSTEWPAMAEMVGTALIDAVRAHAE